MVEPGRVMEDTEARVVQLVVVVVTGVGMMQVLEVATEVVVELPFTEAEEEDTAVQVVVDTIHTGGRRFLLYFRTKEV